MGRKAARAPGREGLVRRLRERYGKGLERVGRWVGYREWQEH